MYSEDYYKVRSSIFKDFPDYKKEFANNHILTSKHAKKLPLSTDTLNEVDNMLLNQHPLLFIDENNIEYLTLETMKLIIDNYQRGDSERFICDEERNKFQCVLRRWNTIWREAEDSDPDIQINVAKVKRSQKRRTDAQKKQKLMKEVWNYPNSWCVGPYVREGPKCNYTKRSPSTRTKFYKRVSNKKIRNSRDEFNPSQKGHYKKHFDYKWEID